MIRVQQGNEVDLVLRVVHLGEDILPVAPPVWTVTDETMFTVTAALDGLSAVLTALGQVGRTTLTVAMTVLVTGDLELTEEIENYAVPAPRPMLSAGNQRAIGG